VAAAAMPVSGAHFHKVGFIAVVICENIKIFIVL
jgi:hypothetical protein